MAKKGQVAEEMIELQITLRALEVEVLGRYISQPKHLDKIRLVLADTFDQLAALGQEKGVAALGCPAGFVHMATCICKPIAAADGGEEKAGLRQRELEKLAKRVR
jgi:hypothetical protein